MTSMLTNENIVVPTSCRCTLGFGRRPLCLVFTLRFIENTFSFLRKFLQTSKTSSASGRAEHRKTDVGAQVQSSWEKFLIFASPQTTTPSITQRRWGTLLETDHLFPNEGKKGEKRLRFLFQSLIAQGLSEVSVCVAFLEGFHWLLENKCALTPRRHRPAWLQIRSVWFLPEQEDDNGFIKFPFNTTSPLSGNSNARYSQCVNRMPEWVYFISLQKILCCSITVIDCICARQFCSASLFHQLSFFICGLERNWRSYYISVHTLYLDIVQFKHTQVDKLSSLLRLFTNPRLRPQPGAEAK